MIGSVNIVPARNSSGPDSSALLDALRRGQGDMESGAYKPTLEQLNKSLIAAVTVTVYGGYLIELLLDRGADPNAEDSSALLGALQRGDDYSVALLEARGAKKLTSGQLNDALMQVPRNMGRCQYKKAVELLVDRGADAPVADFETPPESETSTVA